MTDYRQAFERILKDNPLDSVTRLVYSDWLEENGFDDEALEQRRRATSKWTAAYEWMMNFSAKCGRTCDNYNEVWNNYIAESNAIRCSRDIDDKERRERIRLLQEASTNRQRWRDIIVEDCLRAGMERFHNERYFDQQGQETARDLLTDTKVLNEFWYNWFIITGEPYNASDLEGLDGPFSCSC